MSIAEEIRSGKFERLAEAAEELQRFVAQADSDGRSLHEVEKTTLEVVLALGAKALD